MTRTELELNHEFIKFEKEENKAAIESFMKAIRYQVFNSRELIEGNGGYNIRRGMAHVIAGYCEDIFALYVAKYVGSTDVKYFVDKVIKTEIGGKSKTFKPDLAIVNKDDVLTHYFDLKTNLGYIRDLGKFLEEKNTLIKDLIENQKATITSKKDWLSKKDAHGNINLTNIAYDDVKDKLDIKISKKIKYHIVVVFGGNIGKEAMKENFKLLKDKNKLDYIEFDILKPNDNEQYDIEAFNNIHKSLKEPK